MFNARLKINQLRPSLGGPGWGWWEGAFNLKRDNRGWHGREAGAGENPLGRHPEWLISANESLFSFCLNTLNRAPSDVYLHSLRANVVGVGGRAQGIDGGGRARPLQGWGLPGSSRPPLQWGGWWGEGDGVSQTQPTWKMQPPAQG